MNKLLEKFANQLRIENLTIHCEDNFYYLMNEDSTEDFVLLQLGSEELTVWSYDLRELDLCFFCSVLEELFAQYRVIFPHIEDPKDMHLLQSLGYTEIDFSDEDVDEDTKRNPSFGKVI